MKTQNFKRIKEKLKMSKLGGQTYIFKQKKITQNGV